MLGEVPLGFIRRNVITDTSSEVEIDIHPSASIEEVTDYVRSALHSLQYLMWKQTGRLPPPPDYIPPDQGTEQPF